VIFVRTTIAASSNVHVGPGVTESSIAKWRRESLDGRLVGSARSERASKMLCTTRGPIGPAFPGPKRGKVGSSFARRAAAALARPHEKRRAQARDALGVRFVASSAASHAPEKKKKEYARTSISLPRARGLEDLFAARGEIVGGRFGM